MNRKLQCRRKHNIYYTYTLGDSPTLLQMSDKEKDIGVVIDSNLSFDCHISEQIGKANQILGIIARTFAYKNESTIVTLFKSIVRSHLEFANQKWSPYLKKTHNINKEFSTESHQTDTKY